MDLLQLLKVSVESGASDLFFKVDSPPAVRLHGEVVRVKHPPLTPHDIKDVAYSIMNEDQATGFEHHHELDVAFAIPDLARFRVNIFQQRGSIGIVLRVISPKIRSIEELGLPPVLGEITKRKQGLILVTGPTGSGKSTTLAAMIELINQTKRGHIITIEDPVEYVYEDKLCIVNQREVGIDTDSFKDALKAIVRESPDVILIGEMRDTETMGVALAASETGHLVFSTVHTTSASETMERIINMFPPYDKPQICLRLSKSLISVISQKLVPTKDGKGRACTVEVMIANPTISKYIEEGRSGQIYDAMRDDRAQGGFWGMQTMNQSLDQFVKTDVITEDVALVNAGNITELKQMLRRQ